MTSVGRISSRLVIGTSALLGPRTRLQALGLLEAAYESGITHVDTARAYASGDAESVVGEFMRRHPGEITVTTNFGISPPGAVTRRPALRSLARSTMRLSPTVRRTLGRAGARLSQHGRFDLASARKSIETSLRTLNIDHIDVLLLHDATATDCTGDLLDLLVDMRVQGTIGTFGVGTGRDAAVAIAGSRPEFANVLQFPRHIGTPALDVGGRGKRTLVTHGVLTAFAGLRSALAADRDLRARWNRELDVDVEDAGTLSGLLLACAVADNSLGAVLFSTTREDHLRQNALAIEGPLARPERLDVLRRLLAERA